MAAIEGVSRAENGTVKSHPVSIFKPSVFIFSKKTGTGQKQELPHGSGSKTVEPTSRPYLQYPALSQDIPVFYPVLKLSDFSQRSRNVGPKRKLLCTELLDGAPSDSLIM
jgi:hypothetical protein